MARSPHTARVNPSSNPAFCAAVRKAAHPHARAAFANQMFELSAKAVPKSNRASSAACLCVSRIRGVLAAAAHPAAGQS